MPSDWIQWFDARGTHLARGATLDVRTLPKGRNVVRAVFEDPSAHTTATGWMVEQGGGHAIVHHVIKDTQPPRAPHKHPHPAPRPRREE
jgi:hypothetical protein